MRYIIRNISFYHLRYKHTLITHEINTTANKLKQYIYVISKEVKLKFGEHIKKPHAMPSNKSRST